jgi:hypothetical protein
VITAEDAKSIILRRSRTDEDGLQLAIQSCELSPHGDFWVIRANSEDYVIRGMWERLLVGVSAYLVNVNDGTVTVVGSGQSWQELLQDKYDADAAGAMQYVLEPTFSRDDKMAVINLRQRLECSLQSALEMLSPDHRQWFTGSRGLLLNVREKLKEKGIETAIVLLPSAEGAIGVGRSMWHWDAIASCLRSRFQST